MKTDKFRDMLFTNERIDVWEALFLILVTLKLLGLGSLSWYVVILPLFVKTLAIFFIVGVFWILYCALSAISWCYDKIKWEIKK